MWLDYGLFLSTGLVLVAVIALIVILIRNRTGLGPQLLFVALLVIGLVATPLLRPERFRELGEDLVVTEGGAGPQTEVADIIGLCLSVFRQVGPLSFIVGNDLFPGEDWDRGPTNACDASGHRGTVNLPEAVRSGRWMLCDHATCHQLIRS
jgi:hypothetical protein